MLDTRTMLLSGQELLARAVRRERVPANLKDYAGDVVGGNWRPVIQNLYDAGRAMYVPAGTYDVDGDLAPRNWAPQVLGEGKGRTIFRQQGDSALFSNYSDSAGNRYASRESLATVLTADAASGDTTLAFDTTGYAAGDYAVVKSTAWWNAADHATVTGEIVRVLAVDSPAQVSLCGPIDEPYLVADGAEVRKLDLLDGAHFADFTVENPAPDTKDGWATGIDLRYCLRPQVERVEFRGMDQESVLFGYCVGWRALYLDFYDSTDNGAEQRYGYGVNAVAGSRGGLMLGCNMDRGRHCFSTGPGVFGTFVGNEYGIPPRHNRIAFCDASNMSSHCFDTHEAGRFHTFVSCTARNSLNSGYNARSRDIRYLACEAEGCDVGLGVGQASVGTVIEGLVVKGMASFGVDFRAAAVMRDSDIEDTVGAGVNIAAGDVTCERVRCKNTETGGTAGSKRGFAVAGNNAKLLDCSGEDVDLVARYATGVTGVVERRLRGTSITSLRRIGGSVTFAEFEPGETANLDVQVLTSSGSFTVAADGPETTIQPLALSADRACTLATTGAVAGMSKKIVRATSSTGAFNLNVGTGPLKALASGQWCEVTFNGTAWVLTGFGSL